MPAPLTRALRPLLGTQVHDALDLECLSGGPRPWCFAEANALTGDGLSEALEWLLGKAIRRGTAEEEAALITAAVAAAQPPQAAGDSLRT